MDFPAFSHEFICFFWAFFWRFEIFLKKIKNFFKKGGTKCYFFRLYIWGKKSGNKIQPKNKVRIRMHLQSRYYDPNTGRFISPDKMAFLGSNLDLISKHDYIERRNAWKHYTTSTLCLPFCFLYWLWCLGAKYEKNKYHFFNVGSFVMWMWSRDLLL